MSYKKYLFIVFLLCSKYSFSQSKFFIPPDSSYCILIKSDAEILIALDTTIFEEYYIFKNYRNDQIDDFLIIQKKERDLSLSLAESQKNSIEEKFADYELKNFKRINFKGFDGFIFDSPYYDYPMFSSRGMILEVKDFYFIFLFTYRRKTLIIDDEFPKLLENLLIGS